MRRRSLDVRSGQKEKESADDDFCASFAVRVPKKDIYNIFWENAI